MESYILLQYMIVGDVHHVLTDDRNESVCIDDEWNYPNIRTGKGSSCVVLPVIQDDSTAALQIQLCWEHAGQHCSELVECLCLETEDACSYMKISAARPFSPLGCPWPSALQVK